MNDFQMYEEGRKEAQAEQCNLHIVSGSASEEHSDCPKICKCKKPEIGKPHLGDGGYDWCNICNGVVW